MVGLIVAGLTNEEIAARCHLSGNSVKKYVRTAYRKMGVRTRVQAVLWGLDHGFPASPAASEADGPTSAAWG
jgi:DNA-binding CsgD family transcriptional regulator